MVKLIDEDKQSCILVPTLEISVDMLKRLILKDRFAIKALGPLDHRCFRVGHYENGLFSPLAQSESLKSLGIEPGQTLYIAVDSK